MKKSSKIKNETQAKTTILEKKKTKIPLSFSKPIKKVIFENVLLLYKHQNAETFSKPPKSGCFFSSTEKKHTKIMASFMQLRCNSLPLE